MKNKYLGRKSTKCLNNSFCLFVYFPISKAKVDFDLTRRISRQKLKRLILPSSFKVVKDHIVQGPRMGLIYSSSLNFKKLPTLFELKATSFKLKQKWYTFDLLLSLKSYKTPINLCVTNNLLLENHYLKFYLYINVFSNQK